MKQKQLIDIIAPSSPPKDNKWKKGVKILESWGFKVRFPASALSPYSFHANRDKNRAFFLNQAFSSKDSSIVWMLRGGYGVQKLLPYFIKKYPKKNKKLFVGYSDGTALHTYLNQKNQKTLHAPTVSELAELSQKELNSLKQIILGQKREVIFKNLKFFNRSSYKTKDFDSNLAGGQDSHFHNKTRALQKTSNKTLKGKIIGGNLSLLSSSIGTAWLSSFKSGFLFLEDINEPAYKVDRLLHHLFYSGFLKSIRAVLFGDFKPVSHQDFQKVLKSFSQVCSVPLVYNLPCGHKKRQALPFNTPASLSFQNKTVHLTVHSLLSKVNT